MNCPACKDEVLVALEHQQVEVDYCPACKGVWLDAGEIELLVGDPEAAAAFLTIGSPAKIPDGEKPRRCPDCGKRMTKESTESDPPVIFDHCPRGDGLWFDAGELTTVLDHTEVLVGKGTDVARFLKEIFVASE